MLGKVLDDVDLLQLVISSQDQAIKNISKALTDMVGRIDGLEKHTQKGKLRKCYTIKDDIKKAVRKLVKAKLKGKSLSDIDMVDLTPAQQELVKSFGNAKSVRQIKNAILQYTNAVGTVARNQKFAKQKPIALKEDILVEMTDFIDNGNIRFMPESKTFLLSRMPTPQQIEMMQKISDRINGEIIVECVEQAKEWGLIMVFIVNMIREQTLNLLREI